MNHTPLSLESSLNSSSAEEISSTEVECIRRGRSPFKDRLSQCSVGAWTGVHGKNKTHSNISGINTTLATTSRKKYPPPPKWRMVNTWLQSPYQKFLMVFVFSLHKNILSILQTYTWVGVLTELILVCHKDTHVEYPLKIKHCNHNCLFYKLTIYIKQYFHL